MVNKLNSTFYNTVISQAFSPCGNYLAVGDTFGYLSIFHISKIVNPEASLSKEEITAKCKIPVQPDYQLNSLLSTDTHLIVGGVGEIKAFSWKNLKSNSKNNTPTWTINIHNNKENFDYTDVNCLLFNEENGNLYAGCGDNNIYVFDLQSHKPLKTLSKHEGYVHCLCQNGTDLLSGGEDGVVNMWDSRTYKAVNKVEPHMDDRTKRPELGKWIGAVDCNEDYLLCGGGPHLSLYHYRFLSNTTIFPIEDKGIHVAEIYKDKVLAGGRSKYFYQMNFNGNIITEIPTSAVITYSVVHQEEPFKVLSIAGSSPKIDICSNFMYKDQQLLLT